MTWLLMVKVTFVYSFLLSTFITCPFLKSLRREAVTMSSLPLIVLAKLLLMPTVRIRVIVRVFLLFVCFIYLFLNFFLFCLFFSFLLAPAGVSFNPLRAI